MSDEQPSELLATRRRKLEALREDGIDPFPHAYPGVRSIAEVKAPYDELPDGRGDRGPRTASPAGSPPAAARARWRSSTSSTAPGGCSCRRALDVLGEERSSACSRSTSAT